MERDNMTDLERRAAAHRAVLSDPLIQGLQDSIAIIYEVSLNFGFLVKEDGSIENIDIPESELAKQLRKAIEDRTEQIINQFKREII